MGMSRTGDGAEIVAGMPVWNFDLALDWVADRLDYGGEWYVTHGGRIAEGSCLLARHPVTGELAADAAAADDAAIDGMRDTA